MKSTFRYIVSLLAVCCATLVARAEETSPAASSSADETEMSNQTRDDRRAARGPVYQGCYLNLDLYNPLAGLLNGGRYEWEVSFDAGLWHRLFPVVEYGMMFQNSSSGTLQYDSRGHFFRFGASYNLLNNTVKRARDHALLVGARYCVAHTSFQASGMAIENPYWGETGEYSAGPSSANQGWVEFVAGVRAEVRGGFFLGLWGKVKTFHHNYGDALAQPVYTAGYGAAHDSSVNFGLAFTVSYQFPYKR